MNVNGNHSQQACYTVMEFVLYKTDKTFSPRLHLELLSLHGNYIDNVRQLSILFQGNKVNVPAHPSQQACYIQPWKTII